MRPHIASTFDEGPPDAEDAPLLSAADDNDYQYGSSGQGLKDPAHGPSTFQKPRRIVLIGLFVSFFAVEMGFFMYSAPMSRIMESIVCQRYWKTHDPSKVPPDGHVPEGLCKINAIQTSFTTIRGYYMFFNSLLGILFAIPYSILAEKWGRRPTLRLTVTGFVLNALLVQVPLYCSDVFSPRTIWWSPLSWAIGGGPVFLIAILWNMVAEVTSESERSVVFFRIGIASMGAEFFASTISSVLMTLNPWIPVLIGNGMKVIGFIVILFLPEQPAAPLEVSRSETASCDVASIATGSTDYSSQDSQSSQSSSEACGHQQEQSHAARLRRMILRYGSLLSDHRVLLLLPVFFIYPLSTSGFMAQYISVQLQWTLAQANMLVSTQIALNIPVLLFALPYLSKRLSSHDLSPHETDLYLARASILLFTVAMFGFAFSRSLAILIPSMLVHASGIGFLLLSRSVITGLVEQDKLTRLYTVIEVFRAIGVVTASLLLTNLLKIGLRMGSVWMGLPWFVVGLIYMVATIALWGVRLDQK